METMDIIREYYTPGTILYDIFMKHGELVTGKSLQVADRVPHLGPDKVFIEEAAMLHDIGIFMTNSLAIHCVGEAPYICHGVLGRRLLDEVGYSRHALVCERHTGAGITKENILKNTLPLPLRDMVPVTIEEKIICFADKFYSKNPEKAGRELLPDQIMASLCAIDPSHGERFNLWLNMFGY